MDRANETMKAASMTQRNGRVSNIRYGLASTFLLATFCSGCGGVAKTNASNTPDLPDVAVAKAMKQDVSTTLDIASEFQPYQEVNVYAKVSGYVQKLDVDWGTHVRAGQMLAVLEVPELQQQLEVDQASVRRGEQDVARSQEMLNGAQSEYKVAHLTYTRLADVQKTQPHLVAQEEVDEAQGKDTQADADVSAARDSLAASEQGLAAAKASLEKDKALYGYSQITAPFDGVVTEIDAYKGALLPAGTSSNKGDQPLCHLSDNSRLRLVIPVPESAAPTTKIGNSVQVRVPVLNKTYKGTVAHISDQLDPSTRTMHTEIDIPNPNLEIVPGMYAYATLVLRHKSNVLTVPVQAIDGQGSEVSVFRVSAQNKLERVKLQTGLETPDLVEVTSGLKPNDLVVVSVRSQLREGEVVQPKAVATSTLQGVQ
jgi:RND family efflux transporter MFP subunit